MVLDGKGQIDERRGLQEIHHGLVISHDTHSVLLMPARALSIHNAKGPHRRILSDQVSGGGCGRHIVHEFDQQFGALRPQEARDNVALVHVVAALLAQLL
jgi:hypothetical protein